MSVEVMGVAWYVSGLTPAQKAVLVALADHANPDGRNIYPSVNRITYKTSYSERTVRRALKDLRDTGLIKVARKSTHHSTTQYALDLPEMQVRQRRPARDAPHDLPESPSDLPESPVRPARDAPYPSYNHHEPSLLTNARANEYIPPQSEPVIAMQTALTQVVSTQLWEKNQKDWTLAVDALIGWDATEEQLTGFQAWWDGRVKEARAAGKDYPYPGQPALKSLVEEWRNYLTSLNGDIDEELIAGVDFKVFYEVQDDTN